MLELSPDELLRTTRTVRKRLDYERPVSRSLVEECLELAFQAPNGGNMNSWRWVVIDDRELVARLAALYNQGLDDFIASFDESGYAGASVRTPAASCGWSTVTRRELGASWY